MLTLTELSQLFVKIIIDSSAADVDFMTIEATIDGVPLSDSDQWAVLNENEIENLISRLSAQNELTASQYQFLSKLTAAQLATSLHDWAFGSGAWVFESQCTLSEIFDALSFSAVPDGPEPFLSISAYIVADPATRIARLIVRQSRAAEILVYLVNIDEYVSAWARAAQQIKTIRCARHLVAYQRTIAISGDEIRYDIDRALADCAEDQSKRYRINSAFNTLFEFLATRKLLTVPVFDEAGKLSKRVLKKSDFNELGWALDGGYIQSWLASKHARRNPPDTQPLDDSLVVLRKRFSAHLL
jgi:hypothetical protein